MARTLEIYPHSVLTDDRWRYTLEVSEQATGTLNQFRHGRGVAGSPLIISSVTAETPLELLKLTIDLDVDDTDTDADVDDALFVDDIQPGGGTLTVWEDWQDVAEGIIAGLDPGYTAHDFWSAWTNGDTQGIRNSIQRALVSGPAGIGRGWTILGFHQHEGDGVNTDG